MAPGGDRRQQDGGSGTGLAAELAAARAEVRAVRAEFAAAAAAAAAAAEAAAARLERTETILAATEQALHAATGSAAPPEPAPPGLAVALASPWRGPFQGVTLPGGAVAVLRASCHVHADAADVWQRIRTVLGGNW